MLSVRLGHVNFFFANAMIHGHLWKFHFYVFPSFTGIHVLRFFFLSWKIGCFIKKISIFGQGYLRIYICSLYMIFNWIKRVFFLDKKVCRTVEYFYRTSKTTTKLLKDFDNVRLTLVSFKINEICRVIR